MLNAVSRNIAVQALALAASFADRFLAVGLMVRVWGPDRYAEWALILSAVGLLQLGELGLNVHYGNVWQRAFATGDRVAAGRMLGVALWIGGAQALALLALAAAGLMVMAPGLSVEAVMVYLLLAVFTVLVVARGSISQLYRGTGRYARGMMVTLAGTLSLLLASFAVVGLGGGLVALAASYVLCQLVVGLGFMAWDLRRQVPGLRWVPVRPTGGELRAIWERGRWLALEQCAPVAWLQAPVLALGLAGVAGPALVAFLLIRTLANFARQLASMLSVAVGVEVAALSHAAPDLASHRLQQTGRLVSALMAALAVGAWLFGPAIMHVWSAGAVPFDRIVAAWMLLASVVCAPAIVLARTLSLTGSARPNALTWIVQGGVGALALALLVPMQGVSGAAAALGVAEMAGMGLTLPLLARSVLPRGAGFYFRACANGSLIGGGWCALVGAALQHWMPAAAAPSLLATAAVWCLFGLLPAMVAVLPAGLRRRLRWQQVLHQRQQA